MSFVRRALKHTESVVQREVIRALSLPSRIRARPHTDTVRRAVLLRNDWIGDMILSTGFLRRVNESLPEAEIDVIASPSNAVVLDGLPFVTRIFRHRQGDTRHLWGLRRQLRQVGYDAALNGRVLRPKLTPDTAAALLAAGAARRVGLTGGGADFIYTDPVRPPATGHFIDHLAALARPLGVDPTSGDWRPVLHVGADERAAAERLWSQVRGAGRRILVNVAARTRLRRWPEDAFVAALSRLRMHAPDARVLVIAPPDEFSVAAAVAGRIDGTAARPLLRESFALVAAADIVFTPDTSIAHVASAFATPVVAMFVPGWTGFVPYKTPGRYLCAPGPTLDSLSPEPVAAALELVYTSARSLEPECAEFDGRARLEAVATSPGAET